MKKTVLTFGLISGAILAAMMMATLPFVNHVDTSRGYILGYTTIVLGSLFIFFGIRSYRENVAGGRLTFGRGFAVGILIALISSACYVATWEVIYYNFMPNFVDDYNAHMIEKARAAGASPAELEKKKREAEDFKRMYSNPLINVGMTFLEPFPVELVFTLASAGILRRKAAAQTA
ncbi:MAG TPA: DUF4199 domain-containing protein [Candidatus Acidoferrales bacterium]|nr:DUF4199 domain-containing protein [Candidatus Acidoferrales bacterium]